MNIKANQEVVPGRKNRDLYELYQNRLTKNNALDFDDLINRTLELFYLRPDVLDYYSFRFQYIHVDNIRIPTTLNICWSSCYRRNIKIYVS